MDFTTGFLNTGLFPMQDMAQTTINSAQVESNLMTVPPMGPLSTDPLRMMKRKRDNGHFARPQKISRSAKDISVSSILKDVVHRHLEVCSFGSPRDILLYLAEGNKFRLLPKMLRGLASILEKIEKSYRKNLKPGVPFLVQLGQPLLLHEGKSKVLITPATTNKLVDLYSLCSRTDRCLRAYVSKQQAAPITSAVASKHGAIASKHGTTAPPVQSVDLPAIASPFQSARHKLVSMIEDATAASAKHNDKPSAETVTNHSILRQQTIVNNQRVERPVSLDPTGMLMVPASMGFQQSTL